jgi:hypothetical protein
MKTLIKLMCFICITTPLFGQQARYSLGRFSLLTPLQIAVTQDNNFLVEKGDPLQRLFFLSLSPSTQLGLPQNGPQQTSDQVLTLTMPTLAFQKGARKYEVIGRYMPEFEMFRTNHDQNAWNHSAGAEFIYLPTRTLRFSIIDQYLGSQDPSRALRNPFLLLPRSSFRQNAITTSFEVEASPLTVFRVDYTNMISTYGRTDPFQVRILDTVAHGTSFTATRLINRKNRISGTYSFFKLNPINRERVNDDAVDTTREFEHPIQSVSLKYRYSFSASTVLALSGGVSAMDNGSNYIVGIAGYRRVGDFFLGGGFSRNFSISTSPAGVASGLGAATFYDLLSFRISGRLTRKIAVQSEFGGTFNATKRVVNVGKSFGTRGRVDYRLTDRTVTFASFDAYHQSKNDYVRAPLARNRFTVGLEFSLSSEADRRTDPRNQDEQYVALTDRPRRRSLPD